ncbi:starvation-inducible DNA-binding protein [Cricetibacter osteomyelitidis]|uniref:Starvation-inducible DNA-binding protein n=1 Tax=Cricetibacter osteomyelitidis TaxID=1521931 RepID=A0A4R2T247_9PAST|nr:DNA starvation/stationary phase protection protein [Cricetibacter osteomyelitidis]TCP95236.1 starvation-inducible DNA-binding protein [Cricetibacter osteomyelitidis]
MSAVNTLKTLHASVKTFTFEMQKYHWMIKGKNFYDLHKAFEELYDWGFEQEDEVAERLLIIGSEPLLSVEEVQALNKIIVLPKADLVEEKMTANVKTSLETILGLARLGLTEVEDDVGTDSLLSDLVADVEKRLWMLNAYGA